MFTKLPDPQQIELEWQKNDYKPMTFSLIIPTRNEKDDISATLECLLELDYPHKEIIVVDDSTDETPSIVAAFADRGVRLVHRDVNDNGPCGARNLGMEAASGEVVVLFNADNRPHANFLRLLADHYRSGADWVVVRSCVKNLENAWGRYIHAQSQTGLGDHPRVHNWSEGFSCRLSAAQAVGYIPGDFPVNFCRDHLLGKALDNAGFVKHADYDLVMEHIVPDTRITFYANRHWRATFSAPYIHYFHQKPVPLVALREMAKQVQRWARYLLVFPVIMKARRYSSTNGTWREHLYVGFVEDQAQMAGNFVGLRRLVAEEGWFKKRRKPARPEPAQW